ncbi:MAG: hypothetical protein JNG84_05795 [Archangium sp.]|nr:hypothetical protein [Archangium sp.]
MPRPVTRDLNAAARPTLMQEMRSLLATAVFAFVTASTGAHAEEWDTVLTGPITIKNRALAGSSIKEVWAESDIDAPVFDLQETLMRVERFRFFMPYLKDSREIEKLPDGSVYVYTLIDLPVVGKRDYVVRTWHLQVVKPGEATPFENKWEAFPDRLPGRSGITRLRLNSGSWLVTPLGDGTKSHVVYRFTVDPGGWLPGFAVNLGNEKGVGDTIHGVEREAQRRYRERMASAADAGVVAADAGSPGR